MNILFSIGKAYLPISESFIYNLKKLGAHVACVYEGSAKRAEILGKIKDAEIYITAVAPADRELMDAAPKLKYIIKTGTGVDNIDLSCAAEKGIFVSNAPGENARSVAELVIGQILSLSREIPWLDWQTKGGAWTSSEGTECGGKTLGLVGFGSIGKLVAKYAGALDMRIMANVNHKDFDAAEKLGVTFVEFEQLVAEADYLVLCTSLKKSNYHLIDAATLERMKSTAFLINISRGAMIETEALYTALRKKKIRGAALDVFEIEPPVEVPALDNLIATPHVGGMTLECAGRVADLTVDNVSRFIGGRSLLHVVDQSEG